MWGENYERGIINEWASTFPVSSRNAVADTGCHYSKPRGRRVEDGVRSQSLVKRKKERKKISSIRFFSTPPSPVQFDIAFTIRS